MAFTVQLKNNDLIYLTLDSPQDVKASFMQAVENGLKRRVIKFEIDIAHHLGALEEIFLQVVALQKVLGKRGERVVLIASLSLPAALETQLHAAGVELRIDQEIKLVPDASRESSLTGLTFAEFYKQARLKNWPPLETRFKEVYEELKELIQSERALQKEIEFYKKRIVAIRPLVPESLDLGELAERSVLSEQKLVEIREQNEVLLNEIAQLSQDLQSKQAKYKALATEKPNSDGSETKKNQKGLS